MKSEGGYYQCNKPEDCDPRGCRVSTHAVCKNHRCTCGQGALIGDICTEGRDCVPNGCPPNNHVICNLYAGDSMGVCICIPNWLIFLHLIIGMVLNVCVNYIGRGPI